MEMDREYITEFIENIGRFLKRKSIEKINKVVLKNKNETLNDYEEGKRVIKTLALMHEIIFDEIKLDEEDVMFFDYDKETEPTAPIKIINNQETFKNDDCIICYSEKPNILFCNCGHLCICDSCNSLKNFEKCPVCKTESDIKRKI